MKMIFFRKFLIEITPSIILSGFIVLLGFLVALYGVSVVVLNALFADMFSDYSMIVWGSLIVGLSHATAVFVPQHDLNGSVVLYLALGLISLLATEVINVIIDRSRYCYLVPKLPLTKSTLLDTNSFFGAAEEQSIKHKHLKIVTIIKYFRKKFPFPVIIYLVIDVLAFLVLLTFSVLVILVRLVEWPITLFVYVRFYLSKRKTITNSHRKTLLRIKKFKSVSDDRPDIMLKLQSSINIKKRFLRKRKQFATFYFSTYFIAAGFSACFHLTSSLKCNRCN